MDKSQARLKQRVICIRDSSNYPFPDEKRGKILRVESIDLGLNMFFGSDKQFHEFTGYEPCYSERRIRIENRRTES